MRSCRELAARNQGWVEVASFTDAAVTGSTLVSDPASSHLAKTVGIAKSSEAMARITHIARVDLRKAFPEGHEIQDILPDQIGLALKSVTPTKAGCRLEVSDPLRANELLAKAGGKLVRSTRCGI